MIQNILLLKLYEGTVIKCAKLSIFVVFIRRPIASVPGSAAPSQTKVQINGLCFRVLGEHTQPPPQDQVLCPLEDCGGRQWSVSGTLGLI